MAPWSPWPTLASVPLTQHIRNYINHWNRNPTPFVWTQQPADIVAKAVRRER